MTTMEFAIGLILGFLGGTVLTVCWIAYGLYRMLKSYYATAHEDDDIQPIIHGDGQMWVDRPAKDRAH
jgi:hypothetical protein